MPIISLILVFLFGFLRLVFELQMLQQNSYRNKRYGKWIRGKYPLLPLGSSVAATLLALLHPLAAILALSMDAAYFFGKKSKKRLDFTPRAICSLLVSSLLLMLLAFALAQRLPASWLFSIFLLPAASMLLMMLANFIIKPIITHFVRRKLFKAKRKLAKQPDLIVIGITGSYGKTSTKHFLTRILSEKYLVLMTPGSYNTPLGVAHTILEKLRPMHQIFVVEMGAKQTGDIAEICDIVQPHYGIITAVGEQHLETFFSIENIQKTKFELYHALPPGAKILLNADFPKVADFPLSRKETTAIYYSTQKPLDAYASSIEYSTTGSHFLFCTAEKGDALPLKTPILGEHTISNITAAVAMARELEVSDKQIQNAVKRLEAVPHRLEIKRQDNVIVLDDAFNSNPIGAAMALDVLKRLEGKRKIIVTPGMVELGAKEYERNNHFGKQIARTCDKVYLVGVKQTEAIQQGLREENFPEKQLVLCHSLTEAADHVNQDIKDGDVILYENDLPDTY